MSEEEVKELRFGSVEIRLKATHEDLTLARKLLDMFEEHVVGVRRVRGRLPAERAEELDKRITDALKEGDKRVKELVSRLKVERRVIVGRIRALLRKGVVVKKARGLFGLKEG